MRAKIFLPFALVALMAAVCVAEEEDAKPAARTEAEVAAINAIRAAGAHVLEVAQNDPHLEVAFHLQADGFKDEYLEQVKALKGSVVYLNLRGTKVSDAATAQLGELAELTHLHLEKTAITDAALANLKNLQKLEYLNLYGTAITDAGLEHVAALKNLKRLYLWQTKVTDAGVEKLKQALPELKIDRGLDEPKKEEPKKEEEKKEEPKKEEEKKDGA